jgi:hypothetical protein
MMIMANLALGREGELGGNLIPTVEKAHTHEMQRRLYSDEERQDRRRKVITEFPVGWVMVMLGLWGSGLEESSGRWATVGVAWKLKSRGLCTPPGSR